MTIKRGENYNKIITYGNINMIRFYRNIMEFNQNICDQQDKVRNIF